MTFQITSNYIFELNLVLYRHGEADGPRSRGGNIVDVISRKAQPLFFVRYHVMLFSRHV